MLPKLHNKFIQSFWPIHPKKSLQIVLMFFVGVVCLMDGFIPNADAAEVTLAWDASPSTDVDGYKLYYRQCETTDCTVSKVDENIELSESEVDMSNSKYTYTVNDLSNDYSYAFAVTAYNDSGAESDLSNVVDFTPSDSSDIPDDSDDPGSDDTDNGENQPPTVDAGEDQTIDISSGKAILNGSNTKDDGLPEDGSLKYEWRQSDDNSTAEIENPFESTTTVSFNQPGTYTFELEVDDGQLTASDSVTITVNEAASDDDGTPPDTDPIPPDTDPIPPTGEIVIDNRDIDGDNPNQADPEGIWKISGGKKPYGEDSVYAKFGKGKRYATFIFQFESPSDGEKEVFMWWTFHNTRSPVVPVTITYGNGKVKYKNVNQKKNGGTWNSLGRYYFNQGETYFISITATVPKKILKNKRKYKRIYKRKYKNKSACADAVKIVPVK